MIILKISVKNYIEIFLVGGILYSIIEILWRGYTHWTMTITGGVCCVALFYIFGKIRTMSLLNKCIIGSLVITVIEFISGCIVNLWFNLNVWDYSNMPLNLLGQICPLYSAFWAVLTIPVVKSCDYIKKHFVQSNKDLRKTFR